VNVWVVLRERKRIRPPPAPWQPPLRLNRPVPRLAAVDAAAEAAGEVDEAASARRVVSASERADAARLAHRARQQVRRQASKTLRCVQHKTRNPRPRPPRTHHHRQQQATFRRNSTMLRAMKPCWSPAAPVAAWPNLAWMRQRASA
jgi:hypothetical protein